jgi:hypothetical protein
MPIFGVIQVFTVAIPYGDEFQITDDGQEPSIGFPDNAKQVY